MDYTNSSISAWSIVAIVLHTIKSKTDSKIERLKSDLQQLQESIHLRKEYSNPLLKSAEELYNKLNDIVNHRKRTLGYFNNLSNTILSISSVGDVLESARLTYLTNVFYNFVQFWASAEAIKKDLGLFELSSEKESKDLQSRLKRTLAIFPTGRLHKGLRIRKDHRMKYEGRILSGAATLMAEAILRDDRNGLECITFYEFCIKVAKDPEFRVCLTPLMKFLDGLEEIPTIDPAKDEIDFRWAKLLIFGSHLRDLIQTLDRFKLVTLLPEFELYETDFLESNPILVQNQAEFESTYPVN